MSLARRHRVLLVVLVLAALTLAVFAQALAFGFVNYDDPVDVTGNDAVRQGLTWQSAAWAFTSLDVGYWYPLTWLSHMLDCQLFGLKPWGHHLTNLLLHLADVLLLFALLRSATGTLWRSALAAALFAVHPLHVESVVWVTERKDVLSALFAFLALLAYVRFARRPSWQTYGAVCALMALGLMAKPMVATLPLLMLLMDRWPLDRWGRESALRLLLEKVPLAALAAASGLVTALSLARQQGFASLEIVPLATRVGNALVAYAAYLAKTIVPAGLSVIYPLPPGGWEPWRVWGSGLLLAALSALALWAWRRRPYFAVGWFWFLAALLPVIGFVPMAGQAWADRYTYLPLVGLFVAAAWGLGDLASWRPALARVVPTAAVVAVALLAVAAARQAGFWRDSVALYTRALAVTSGNYAAHTGLGLTLVQKGREREALNQFDRAIAANPRYAPAWKKRGMVLARSGRLEEAARSYAAAVDLAPHDTGARHDWALVLESQGRYEESARELSLALSAHPGDFSTTMDLGRVLAKKGDAARAADAFAAAASLRPDDPAPRFFQGLALKETGHPEKALACFRWALRLDPGSAQAREQIAMLEALAPGVEGKGTAP